MRALTDRNTLKNYVSLSAVLRILFQEFEAVELPVKPREDEGTIKPG
jgi:hypothetical protein